MQWWTESNPEDVGISFREEGKKIVEHFAEMGGGLAGGEGERGAVRK